jgi:hypothetical protein
MAEMKPTLVVVMTILLVIVVGVLFLGIFAMAKGGKFNERYGNKLMRLRVAVQLLAVLLLGGIMWFSKH